MTASQLSPDAPAEICPRFRGVSHQLAFLVALPLAIAFAFIPDTAAGHASAAVYGAGVAFMFGASGAYHRIRWSWPRWQSLARRVDHAGIFLLIAASYTPAGLLILHGGWRLAVLGVVWIGAGIAIVVKLCWLDAPKWVVAGIAIALGWVAVLVLPQMWASVGAVGCALIVAGGVAYTVGAIVYALERPDPRPHVFGYHEVFHALVVLAVALQYVAIAFFVSAAMTQPTGARPWARRQGCRGAGTPRAVTIRRRWWVIGIWVALLLFGAGFSVERLSDRWFQSFSIPGYQAYETNQKTVKTFGSGEFPPLVAVFQSKRDMTKEKRVRSAIQDGTNAWPGSRSSSWFNTGSDAYLSKDGNTIVALIYPPGNQTFTATERIKNVRAALQSGVPDGVTVHLTGRDPLTKDVGGSGGPSLLVEILIGVAGALLVLLFVSGTLPAVLVPLIVAACSILTTFTLIWALHLRHGRLHHRPVPGGSGWPRRGDRLRAAHDLSFREELHHGQSANDTVRPTIIPRQRIGDRLRLDRGDRPREERGLTWSLAHTRTIIVGSVLLFGGSLLLARGIGAEFMPKLDEGALWVRATMPYTISLDESAAIVPQIRAIIRSFPEVTVVASEHGRPDDGTDATGFFNAEFYVGLRPYREWHWGHRTKAELTAAINQKLTAFPGITFNYTQPAEDAVDEAETGLKSSLDVKLFGPDLSILEGRGKEIKQVLDKVPGITEVTLVRELGQPSLNVSIDRDKIARYGVNVDDVNGLIQAAVGGNAATQVVQGEKLFDLVVRLQPQFRETPEEIGDILVATPAGREVPLRELATIKVANGASFIYRQDNARYIGVQFSVEGRDLASAVQDAQRQVAAKLSLPFGYHLAWGGEYEEYTASRTQLYVVVPLTLLVITMLLFVLYRNFKFPLITVVGVILSAPIGGVVALALSGTPFSVSSGIGFLALFGVSVQTAVVYISYVNELRRTGMEIAEATTQAALLRLRPIMMTALVAALGLLPAALSTDVRVGFAAAVRTGDRRRTLLPTVDQRLFNAGAISDDGTAWRYPGSLAL